MLILYVTRRSLKQLKYICLTNSQRLRFFIDKYDNFSIKVIPDEAPTWTGDIDSVYKAFSSPSAWGARARINKYQQKIDEVSDTNNQIDEYKAGMWKEDINISKD